HLHRDLNSFPTRRSSDLQKVRRNPAGAGQRGSGDEVLKPESLLPARPAPLVDTDAEGAAPCREEIERKQRIEGPSFSRQPGAALDRKSTRLNSSHVAISY